MLTVVGVLPIKQFSNGQGGYSLPLIPGQGWTQHLECVYTLLCEREEAAET